MSANRFSIFLTNLVELFFGAADELLYALLTLIVLDYITGVCVAIHQKKVSSEIGASGIAKKIAVLALISVAHIVDEYLLHAVDVVRTMTTTFYLCNECISILENVSKLGIDLPKKLKQVLNSIKSGTRPPKP